MANALEHIVERFKQHDPGVWKALGRYMQQGFVSLKRHVTQRHVEHYERLRRKICVYLDQKYWIYLRDARSGSPQSPFHQKLLELLDALLRDARIVCPVSSSTLFETAKVRDQRKRAAMSSLIDEFSQGIAIRPMKERIQIELFEAWSKREKAVVSSRSSHRYVWTHPSWALGHLMPSSPRDIPPKYATAIGKVFADELMSMPFSQALDSLYPTGLVLPDNHEEVVNAIDSGQKDPNSVQMRFKDEFLRECVGFLCDGILVENRLIREPEYHPYPQPEPSLSVSDNKVLDFLSAMTQAVVIERNACTFPSLYLWAGLHTKGKVGRSSYAFNDICDFDHACAAVPYCEAFLTERRLATWLRQPPLAVGDHFDCAVIGDDESAIEYLEQLL